MNRSTNSIHSFIHKKPSNSSFDSIKKTRNIQPKISLKKYLISSKQSDHETEITTNKSNSRNVGFFLGNVLSVSKKIMSKEANKSCDSPLKKSNLRNKRHSISYSNIPVGTSLVAGANTHVKNLFPFLPQAKILEFQKNFRQKENFINKKKSSKDLRRLSASFAKRSKCIPGQGINIVLNKSRRNTKFYIEYKRHNIEYLLNEPLTKDIEQKRKEFEEFKKNELITVFQSILIKKAQKDHYGDLLKDIISLLNKSKIEYEYQKEHLNESLQIINKNFRNPPKEIGLSKQKIEIDKKVELNKEKINKKQEFKKQINDIMQNLERNEQNYITIKNELDSLQEYTSSLISDLKIELNDLKKKYKRTVLGMAWSIISPLLTLLVMWLVFTQFFGRTVEHYTTYLFCGNLVFSYFNDSTGQGMASLLENASIFTKVNVPKYLFLFSKNVQTLINFGLTLLVFALFCILDGISFTWLWVLLLYPVTLLLLFNTGIGLILSALFVFFRDIQYLWSVFTQLLMYMSAIFYTVDYYGPTVQILFHANPLYVFITYFRTVVIDGAVPSLWIHGLLLLYTGIALGIGCWMYKKYNHRFLYYV